MGFCSSAEPDRVTVPTMPKDQANAVRQGERTTL